MSKINHLKKIMRDIMSLIKIGYINIFVLVVLLVIVEIGLRFAWTFRECSKGKCDFSRVTHLKIHSDNFSEKNIGISQFHEKLGYVPKPGFNEIVEIEGWNKKTVTINESGYRANDNPKGVSIKRALAVGDSFTFGDQVNNNETWPSCLERVAEIEVANAGVFGYGSAQAVRRATFEARKHKFDLVILGILLNSNFYRDQLRFKVGFPKPAVVISDGVVTFSDVPPISSTGTKYNPVENKLNYNLARNSMLMTLVFRGFKINYSGNRRSELSVDAAPVHSIIKFTLNELDKVNIKRKIVVLQYGGSDLKTENQPRPEVQAIREKVIEHSKSLNIPVVDTYKTLYRKHTLSKNPLWDGHHTAWGNKVVCNQISEAINF